MAERRRVETTKESRQLKHLHLYTLDKELMEKTGDCSRCGKTRDQLWVVPQTSEGKVLICNDCYREILWIATRGLRRLKKHQQEGGDLLDKAIRVGHVGMKSDKS